MSQEKNKGLPGGAESTPKAVDCVTVLMTHAALIDVILGGDPTQDVGILKTFSNEELVDHYNSISGGVKIKIVNMQDALAATLENTSKYPDPYKKHRSSMVQIVQQKEPLEIAKKVEEREKRTQDLVNAGKLLYTDTGVELVGSGKCILNREKNDELLTHFNREGLVCHTDQCDHEGKCEKNLTMKKGTLDDFLKDPKKSFGDGIYMIDDPRDNPLLSRIALQYGIIDWEEKMYILIMISPDLNEEVLNYSSHLKFLQDVFYIHLGSEFYAKNNKGARFFVQDV